MNRSKQAGMAIKTMVALLVGLNLASVHVAEAQQPVAKVPRIGFVLASGREGPAIPPFRQGLRELGYVEGKNILIEYRYAEVRGPNPNLDGAFQAATKDRVNALITITGGLFNLYTKRIADLAIKNRLPSMNERSEYVEAGALMSYAANDADLYKRAATYVDKILKGTKPADLPVEQPAKFEFVVNLKTAKALKLTIPQSVLFRADKVIK